MTVSILDAIVLNIIRDGVAQISDENRGIFCHECGEWLPYNPSWITVGSMITCPDCEETHACLYGGITASTKTVVSQDRVLALELTATTAHSYASIENELRYESVNARFPVCGRRVFTTTVPMHELLKKQTLVETAAELKNRITEEIRYMWHDLITAARIV